MSLKDLSTRISGKRTKDPDLVLYNRAVNLDIKSRSSWRIKKALNHAESLRPTLKVWLGKPQKTVFLVTIGSNSLNYPCQLVIMVSW